MPPQVDDIKTLQKYLAGVDDRGEHHGEEVGEVVFPLVGAGCGTKTQTNSDGLERLL